ncbi:MAG: peptidoglycan DD-metalloendopeptidase family protein [Nitriliruptorales bacterium]|nr:peptidoglycan DD-metalloendopeptidase family protein [Nitriliruptorales bacterium]
MNPTNTPIRWWAIVSMLAVALATPASAHDRSEDEIAEEMHRTGQQASEVADDLAITTERIAAAREELAVLQDRLAAQRGRLQVLEGQLALAQEGLAAAEVRREAAEENLAQAERLLRFAEEELAAAETRLQNQVVAAYKYGVAGRSDWMLQAVRQARDPNDLVSNIYKLRSVVEHQDTIVHEVLELRQEREDLLVRAEETRRQTEEARDDAEHTLAVVASLRDDAKRVAEEIARDEQRQQAVLNELQADAAAYEQVLEELRARQAALEEEQEAARARRVAAGGAVCPVEGAKAGRDFTNDWGYPRPGGRRHEGTDIFASRGTPVYAMYDGTIKELRRVDTGIGGLFVSYWVAPGEHWYNAHLDTVAPGISVGDAVAAGQQIGTVGNSGNARTTPPHLHIGHYFDDVAENPYPVLADACQ